jgi:hypothetical protein
MTKTENTVAIIQEPHQIFVVEFFQVWYLINVVYPINFINLILTKPVNCSPLRYLSIRQHTSAYVSIRQHTSAYVSIRQHTSAYVSIRSNLRCLILSAISAVSGARAPVSDRKRYARHEFARFHFERRGRFTLRCRCYSRCSSIRQHTSAYVSIRQHTSTQSTLRCRCNCCTTIVAEDAAIVAVDAAAAASACQCPFKAI